jgi:hypothetical protein
VSGDVNGGRYPLRIVTVNGDIQVQTSGAIPPQPAGAVAPNPDADDAASGPPPAPPTPAKPPVT